MSFQDDMASDIMQTFLCEEEFSKPHMIDGRMMCASVDEVELSRRSKRNSGSHEDGYHKKEVLLFVAASEFGSLPAVNRIITMDGRRYMVKDARDEDGMYAVVLEVMRA